MTIVLNAKKRETGQRSTLTQLRKGGQLAAIVYGYQTDATPIALDYKETAKAVQKNGYTSVFTIDIEGKKVNAVLTEIQRDAIKGHVKHVDFLAVNMAQELEVEVPISLIGTAAGVKDGGVLTQPNHTLKISVKPADMPDSIEIDVSMLNVGDTLSVAAVRDQIKYNVLNDDDFIIVTLTPPTQVGGIDEEAAGDLEGTEEKPDSDQSGRED